MELGGAEGKDSQAWGSQFPSHRAHANRLYCPNFRKQRVLRTVHFEYLFEKSFIWRVSGNGWSDQFYQMHFVCRIHLSSGVCLIGG